MLSFDRACELFVYYPVSGVILNRVDRHKVKAGTVATHNFSSGYLGVKADGFHMLAHRLIELLMRGANCENVDHVNGDKKDNRWGNLSFGTVTQNARNKRLHKNNTSGFHGVGQRENGRWYATFRENGRQVYLGTFDTREDAVEARKLREKLHGYNPNHGRSI